MFSKILSICLSVAAFRSAPARSAWFDCEKSIASRHDFESYHLARQWLEGDPSRIAQLNAKTSPLLMLAGLSVACDLIGAEWNAPSPLTNLSPARLQKLRRSCGYWDLTRLQSPARMNQLYKFSEMPTVLFRRHLQVRMFWQGLNDLLRSIGVTAPATPYRRTIDWTKSHWSTTFAVAVNALLLFKGHFPSIVPQIFALRNLRLSEGDFAELKTSGFEIFAKNFIARHRLRASTQAMSTVLWRLSILSSIGLFAYGVGSGIRQGYADEGAHFKELQVNSLLKLDQPGYWQAGITKANRRHELEELYDKTMHELAENLGTPLNTSSDAYIKTRKIFVDQNLDVTSETPR